MVNSKPDPGAGFPRLSITGETPCAVCLLTLNAEDRDPGRRTFVYCAQCGRPLHAACQHEGCPRSECIAPAFLSLPAALVKGAAVDTRLCVIKLREPDESERAALRVKLTACWTAPFLLSVVLAVPLALSFGFWSTLAMTALIPCLFDLHRQMFAPDLRLGQYFDEMIFDWKSLTHAVIHKEPQAVIILLGGGVLWLFSPPLITGVIGATVLIMLFHTWIGRTETAGKLLLCIALERDQLVKTLRRDLSGGHLSVAVAFASMVPPVILLAHFLIQPWKCHPLLTLCLMSGAAAVLPALFYMLTSSLSGRDVTFSRLSSDSSVMSATQAAYMLGIWAASAYAFQQMTPNFPFGHPAFNSVLWGLVATVPGWWLPGLGPTSAHFANDPPPSGRQSAFSTLTLVTLEFMLWALLQFQNPGALPAFCAVAIIGLWFFFTLCLIDLVRRESDGAVPDWTAAHVTVMIGILLLTLSGFYGGRPGCLIAMAPATLLLANLWIRQQRVVKED